MSDTLSAIRKAIRQSQSAERRKLKHSMKGAVRISVQDQRTKETKHYRYPDYDSDKAPYTAPDRDYDPNTAKTTNDVIAETLEIARNTRIGGRVSVSRDSTDRLLNECNVVSPEIRAAWHAKVGMSSLLSDECRMKLQQSAGVNSMKSLHEARLNDLAKWMVWMWCDEEGYDPDKHPKVTK